MQVDMISLRNLHVFASVAASGSVSRSAEQLYRAQSAVTRSIIDLERQLGVALFERKARGMLLNEFGRRVFVRTQRIEDELLAAQRQILTAGRLADRVALLQPLMNERRLQTFVELTKHNHLATVATSRGITRAAVSASVHELESQLRVPLFERSARGLLPTASGRALAFRARRALSELRVVPQDVAAMQGSMEGVITIGALPLARTVLLPQAMTALIAKHAGAHIRTVESPYEMLVSQLLGGDLDFIIGALRSADCSDELQAEPLFREEICILARRGHPLARRSRLSARDLAKAQWTLSRHGSPTRELIADALIRGGAALPMPMVETGDLAVLRGVLASSDLITAISPQQMQYEIADGSLVVLRTELDLTGREIGITTRRGNLASPIAEEMLRFLKSAVLSGGYVPPLKTPLASGQISSPVMIQRRRRAI